jgi:hypothetical protein
MDTFENLIGSTNATPVTPKWRNIRQIYKKQHELKKIC